MTLTCILAPLRRDLLRRSLRLRVGAGASIVPAGRPTPALVSILSGVLSVRDETAPPGLPPMRWCSDEVRLLDDRLARLRLTAETDSDVLLLGRPELESWCATCRDLRALLFRACAARLAETVAPNASLAAPGIFPGLPAQRKGAAPWTSPD
jgi:hypothetical protein